MILHKTFLDSTKFNIKCRRPPCNSPHRRALEGPTGSEEDRRAVMDTISPPHSSPHLQTTPAAGIQIPSKITNPTYFICSVIKEKNAILKLLKLHK